MRILPILLLLILATFATAAPTVYTDVYRFGGEGIIWDAEGWAEWAVGDNPLVEWDHSLPLPASVSLSEVQQATLTIEGYGIDNILGDWDGDGLNEGIDAVAVYMDGLLLGNLQGNVTTFDLDTTALTDPLLTSAKIEFRFDRNSLADMFWQVDTARLTTSKLNLLTDGLASANIVPAPGAILLCGLGTLLAGHLKRRNSL